MVAPASLRLRPGPWSEPRYFRLGALFIALFAAVLILFMPLHSIAYAEPAPLTALVDEALANNQDLQAMAGRIQALRAEAPFAGSLQDPVVTLGLVNVPVDTFNLDQEAMTQKVVAISQRIPWFGKLDLAEQAVLLSALQMEARYQASRLKVTRQVREAWYDLSFTSRSLEVNSQLQTMVSQDLRVAETRYATGIGLQQDIFTAQVQLSELMDEQQSLTARRRSLQDQLASLLNRGQPFTDTGGEPPPLILPLRLDRSALTDKSLAHNPLILERRLDIELADNEIAQAEKAYMPDLTISAGYGQREDTPLGDDRADFLSTTVSFTVPLWQSTRQDSKLAAAQFRRTAAQRALAGLRSSLPHQVDGLIGELEGSSENLALFQEAVAIQAGQLAESSLDAYSVGKVEFATMLTAHIKSLRLALKTDEYRYRILKKLAELDELTAALPAANGD